MAPVILELKSRDLCVSVCTTGQQRQMLDQMLGIFNITPDHDLNIMSARQTLDHISAQSLSGLGPVIDQEKPDFVLVQGDTTTAFIGALVAFYHKVPIAHVEAGLRTQDKYNPYPEEMNRRLITQLADHHFAPTPQAKANLIASGVGKESIHVVGNTVIDALNMVSARKLPITSPAVQKILETQSDIVLITTHRRENLGQGMDQIFTAIAKLAAKYPSLDFIFPVHLNPAIQAHVAATLSNYANVHLMSPLEYSDLVKVMQAAKLILTDSGGIQEEAPTFGVPVLVLRTTTERPEGVEAGVAKLVGAEAASIFKEADALLSSPEAHAVMAKSANPYGDGRTAKRIVDILIEAADS